MPAFLTIHVPMWVFLAVLVILVICCDSYAEVKRLSENRLKENQRLRDRLSRANSRIEEIDEQLQADAVSAPFGDIRDRH